MVFFNRRNSETRHFSIFKESVECNFFPNNFKSFFLFLKKLELRGKTNKNNHSRLFYFIVNKIKHSESHMLEMMPILVDNLHQSPVEVAPHLEQKRTSNCSDCEPDSGLHLFYSLRHGRIKDFSVDVTPNEKIAWGQVRGPWGPADQCVVPVGSPAYPLLGEMCIEICPYN